jgi:hypothetical protein
MSWRQSWLFTNKSASADDKNSAFEDIQSSTTSADDSDDTNLNRAIEESKMTAKASENFNSALI